MKDDEQLETAKCRVCGQPFERDVNRPQGKLVSCPAHSFGEVEEDTSLVGKFSEYMAKSNLTIAAAIPELVKITHNHYQPILDGAYEWGWDDATNGREHKSERT